MVAAAGIAQKYADVALEVQGVASLMKISPGSSCSRAWAHGMSAGAPLRRIKGGNTGIGNGDTTAPAAK